MAAPNLDITSARPSLAAPIARRSIRTLVVDDTPATLQLFSRLLGMNPRVQVIGTATDGLSAVALAQAERPDLILMDVNMPRMDGLKAALHIKRRLPDTRIILMSADDDPEIALAAMDCGADGFLPKHRWANYKWHVDHWFFSLQ